MYVEAFGGTHLVARQRIIIELPVVISSRYAVFNPA
jgi:hypothetical protein